MGVMRNRVAALVGAAVTALGAVCVTGCASDASRHVPTWAISEVRADSSMVVVAEVDGGMVREMIEFGARAIGSREGAEEAVREFALFDVYGKLHERGVTAMAMAMAMAVPTLPDMRSGMVVARAPATTSDDVLREVAGDRMGDIPKPSRRTAEAIVYEVEVKGAPVGEPAPVDAPRGPAFAPGFAALGPARYRVVVAPAADLRATIVKIAEAARRESNPPLNKRINALLDKVKWLAASMDLKPGGAVVVIAEMETAASAREMRDLLAQSAEKVGHRATRLLLRQHVRPVAAGTRVEARIAEPAMAPLYMEGFNAVIGDGFFFKRQLELAPLATALRAAAERDGAFPTSLDDPRLKGVYAGGRDESDGPRPKLVLVGGGMKLSAIEDPSMAVVAHQELSTEQTFSGRGVEVCFADGTAQRVVTRQALDALLANGGRKGPK